jgi:putative transposase
MHKRKFSKEFKTKVAVEALKGVRTIREISVQYQIHPNLVMNWKKQLISGIPGIFEGGHKDGTDSKDQKIRELYQEVGELQYELSWLKKKTGVIS